MFILCTKSLKHPNARSGLVVKNLPAEAGNSGEEGLIPGLGRSPRVGDRNPPQYSCLENSMDKWAWWATVCSVLRVGGDLATEQDHDV